MITQLQVPGGIPDVAEIRVLEWHGAEGRPFSEGDLIVELETHKAVVEVRAGRPALLRRILCAAGEWRQIGFPLALLSDTMDEAVPDAADGLDPMIVAFEIV